MKQPYFLAYQQAWLDDQSRLKIAEKSRRIGWTYAQAYEDVRDAARAEGAMDVWFTSADLSAAREYIRYCEMFARLFDKAARNLDEIVIDDENDIKALVIEFASGKRINAMSSNPKGFRSKGGKVVIDEYAFHESADELWKAAAPSILWGYPIRVFSSHNGKNTRFYRMVQEARQPGSRWSVHRATIQDAIDAGLVERIRNLTRRATPEEVAEFLEECHAIAGDEDTFQQEFMCNPLDDKTAFIPYADIYANEKAELPQPHVVQGAEVNLIWHEDYRPELPPELILEPKRRYFLGVDIGRRRDLTVLWVLEEVVKRRVTRAIIELHAVKFRQQYKWLELILPFMARACIDDTGIGMQLAEDAIEDFGAWRVEGVTFSAPVKEVLAYAVKRALEDRAVDIPQNELVRKDINKIKRTTTVAGNVRFEGERDADGHADRFWALGLAEHASGKGVRGPTEYKSVVKSKFSTRGLL